MKARILLGLLGMVAGLLLPPEAEAYTYIQRLGCPGDTGASWPNRLLPSRWHVHNDGYSKLSMAEVVEVFERSIGAWGGDWGNPCCSGFRHAFAGPTLKTPLDSEDENVVGFAEATWPRYLGSSFGVIAVTIPRIEPGSCAIHEADMLFNAVRFEFRTDGELDDPGAVDFESIAVHEFGHWIGLDHPVDPTSPIGYLSETVMFPSYRGGTDARTLFLDDMLGACALYPTSCGECREDRDCPDGQVCQGGSCNGVACSGNLQCPMGSVCGDDGLCHRGCRLHAECGPNSYCAEGACLPRMDCAVCRPCRRNSDCGPNGYFCASFGEDVRLCTKICTSDAECDGDSACHIVQDGVGYCGAPDPNSFCPSGYVCSNTACPDLGEPCGSCGARTDACVSTSSGHICSCTCSSDADCGTGKCLPDPASGHPTCYPTETLAACGGGHFCPHASACGEDGSCLPRCGNSLCTENEYCDQGACKPICPKCPAGEVCDPLRRSCVIEESCLGITCGEGKRCVDGTCHTACGEGICKAGQRCESGRCVSKKKDSGGCSTGGGASDPVTLLLFLALLAGARASRRAA